MNKLTYCVVFIAIIMAGCALWKAKYLAQDEGDIVFSHKKHIEMEADCEMCHAGAAESELSSDNNYPKEEDCLLCHEREQCSLCHINVEQAIHLLPESTGLIFSHKAHLDSQIEARKEARSLRAETINGTTPFVKEGSLEKQIDCSTCHALVKESIKVADKYPIKMENCRSCHEITQDNCAICHYDLGEKYFVPASHYIAWLDRHQYMAAAEGEALCGNCHRGEVRPSEDIMPAVTEDHVREEDSRLCAECHRGDLWPEVIHDSNRLQSHGIDARANKNLCNSCHQREECISCHDSRGIAFSDVHPAGWQFGHADKARRQLSACTACHGEEDCLGCHQTISPHAADWDREITDQNKQVCSKCHAI
jgi:predicted CXXCH cytochrome family protein